MHHTTLESCIWMAFSLEFLEEIKWVRPETSWAAGQSLDHEDLWGYTVYPVWTGPRGWHWYHPRHRTCPRGTQESSNEGKIVKNKGWHSAKCQVCANRYAPKLFWKTLKAKAVRKASWRREAWTREEAGDDIRWEWVRSPETEQRLILPEAKRAAFR